MADTNRTKVSEDLYKLLEKQDAVKRQYQTLVNKKSGINKGRIAINDAQDNKTRALATATEAPTIHKFIEKLQNFYFSPPSDNLWVVKIPHLQNLWTHIVSNVLPSWKFGTKWKIKVKDNKEPGETKTNLGANVTAYSEGTNNFVGQLSDSQMGLFLAQNIDFTPFTVQSTNSWFTEAQQHSGFLNFGNIVNARNNSNSLKVAFLISNWDITDLIIEPWIAAIAQMGTVDSENATIKTNITIQEYSAGVPKNLLSSNRGYAYPNSMQVRKVYKFYNCYPVSRGSVSKNYDPMEAGSYKTSIVDFRYEDYQIEYKI